MRYRRKKNFIDKVLLPPDLLRPVPLAQPPERTSALAAGTYHTSSAMESGSLLKGLAYGGFASCVAETSKARAHQPQSLPEPGVVAA